MSPSTKEDGNTVLTSFLHEQDENNDGGTNIKGLVDGFASPLGRTERNRKLAKQRANFILERIKNVLPNANFVSRSFGEDLWKERGVAEVDDSEKHRVVILTIRKTFSQHVEKP